MWIPSKLEVVPISFSFESSGQGVHRDLALRADDETLVNMLECVEWADDPVQVEICDACGYAGCATGGYVAARRLGAHVVLAPSIEAYRDSGDEWARTNVREPRLLRKRGLPLIAETDWERLRAEGAPLPPASGFRSLTWREAALAAQLEAPLRLLGDPGTRSTPLSARVAATDPWLDPAMLDRLGDPLAWGAPADAGVSMRQSSDATLYSLVVTEPLMDVVLFGSVDGVLGLYFEPGLLVLPAATGDLGLGRAAQ